MLSSVRRSPPCTGQGPTLRFHNGRLRRVHVARPEFATKRGVEVGDRAREVRRKYSSLRRDAEIAGGPVPWVLQQECV